MSHDLALLRFLESLTQNRVPDRSPIHYPTKIPVSPLFIENYRRMVHYLLPQCLTSTFRLRQFFVHQDDATERCRITDPFFWQRLPAHFSQKAVDRLWEIYALQVVKWHDVDPWDALILSMLYSLCRSRYSWQWLIEKQADWVIMAYFLLMQTDNNFTDPLPWRQIFSDSFPIPYPIRFLSLELTAGYYQKTIDMLEQKLELAKSEEFWQKTAELKDYCDPRNPHFFNWVAELKKQYAFENVRKSYLFWINEGMIGYDDDHYLKSQESAYGLFQKMTHLEKLCRDLAALSGEKI